VTEPAGLLEVGTFGRTHGVRGEIYLDLVSDREERRRVGSRLWCDGRWVTLTKVRPNNDRLIVAVDGITSLEEARLLTTLTVYGEPIADEEALWVHELVGSRVVGVDDTDYGVCTAVLDNPAHLILETDIDVLIPVPFVVRRDDSVVVVDPPAGLLDLKDNS
jgi:16S rRNA processing protein RimM